MGYPVHRSFFLEARSEAFALKTGPDNILGQVAKAPKPGPRYPLN